MKTQRNSILALFLLAIIFSSCRHHEVAAKKPVIYLYPTQTEHVSVKLISDCKLTITEPDYNEGWNVTASPDGKLINQLDGKEFPYLFYEANYDHEYSFGKGFCIEGKNAKKFLENILPQMGLKESEYSEFISYWSPLMEKNKFNLITFPNEEQAEMVKLDIQPKPETVIRVFMVFKSVDSNVSIPAQTFSSPERKGFTVVEWGGVNYDELIIP